MDFFIFFFMPAGFGFRQCFAASKVSDGQTPHADLKIKKIKNKKLKKKRGKKTGGKEEEEEGENCNCISLIGQSVWLP